jgi:hypothetical protein
MKMIDKIDIDKEGENIEQLRKSNNQIGKELPTKEAERGFCTKCLIY